MLRTCPYSGEIFEPKRRDQVYASPAARMRYHNESAANLRRIKAPVDKALEKNFMILSSLLKEGETKTFDKEFLVNKGYNPSFFTHIEKYNDKVLMCLYHYMIYRLDGSNSMTITYPKKDA